MEDFLNGWDNFPPRKRVKSTCLECGTDSTCVCDALDEAVHEIVFTFNTMFDWDFQPHIPVLNRTVSRQFTLKVWVNCTVQNILNGNSRATPSTGEAGYATAYGSFEDSLRAFVWDCVTPLMMKRFGRNSEYHKRSLILATPHLTTAVANFATLFLD